MTALRESLINIADIAKDAQRLIEDGRTDAAIVALGSIVERVNSMTSGFTSDYETPRSEVEVQPEEVEETSPLAEEAGTEEEVAPAEETEEAAPADDAVSFLEGEAAAKDESAA